MIAEPFFARESFGSFFLGEIPLRNYSQVPREKLRCYFWPRNYQTSRGFSVETYCLAKNNWKRGGRTVNFNSSLRKLGAGK